MGQFHLSLITILSGKQGKDDFPYVPGGKQTPEVQTGCNLFQGQWLTSCAGRTLKILTLSTVHIA